MQNKANLPDTQMNASYVKTKNCEQKTMDNEPTKQTQSNPIYGEPVEPTNPISIKKLLDAAKGDCATSYFCLIAARISRLMRALHQFWPHIEQ